MEKLTQEQQTELGKMSTERLWAKLVKIGYDEDTLGTMNRAQLQNTLAMCVIEGRDKPPAKQEGRPQQQPPLTIRK